MTHLELVEDTIKYYRENDRGMTGGWCQYRTEDGKRCAVGRWIDESKLHSKNLTFTELSEMGSVSNLVEEGIILSDILKDKVKDIQIECWEELQDYHDYGLLSGDKGKKEDFLLKKWKNS